MLSNYSNTLILEVFMFTAGQITPRLVEGNASSGRLEILYNGTWNLVCDEGFGLQEAEVACRMLGFDRCVIFLQTYSVTKQKLFIRLTEMM